MEVERDRVRAYRLAAHHLAGRLPAGQVAAAAGACGLQNSPPGAWETAIFNRVKGCSLQTLNEALYKDKTLLQAWSFRGAPVVFPTEESDAFLTPLIAQAGETPWVYTLGITGALDHLGMGFDDLLMRTKRAAGYLDDHTVKSKEVLDQTLADIIEADLPKDKRALWRAPSMYGNPEKQTVGGAAVSFLLRPCAFYSLVVFGERQGASPTFTSFKNWLGHAPGRLPDAEKALVRKFLHCYGPATVDAFTAWLGCSKRQAKRLWATVADEVAAVHLGGKACQMLLADVDSLQAAEAAGGRLVLLGAHDPYLDMRDRAVILEETALQKMVWRTVGNPGAVLKGGRIVGIWKGKTLKDRLEVTINTWETPAPGERQTLADLAEEYAAFRQLRLQSCTMEGL